MTLDIKTHWDNRHRSTSTEELSWYQSKPTVSLELIDVLEVTPDNAIIDIGGGVSKLVDGLLERGHRDVTVLDVSNEALRTAAARISTAAVRWEVADVLTWRPDRQWQLWHDRATFHFLTDAADRASYLDTLSEALAPGGALIIATFSPNGPEQCSGLPVHRYEAEMLLAMLRTRIDVKHVTHLRELHQTPNGTTQELTWLACRRQS